MLKAYIADRIYTSERVLQGYAVLVDDGRIHSIIPRDDVHEDIPRQEFPGCSLAPALIDLQIYGGGGLLFSTHTGPDSIAATYEYCLRGGASHFMITLATNTYEVFDAGIRAVREYWKQGGKGLLGLHLEGPYIHPDKRGAHLSQCVVKPERQEVQALLDRGSDVIRMMTLAPEQCPEDVIDLLLTYPILLSVGHSNATYEQGFAAFDRGIPMATHLFNAMSSFHHRAPGLPGAIFDHDSARASIVPDGIHVQDAVMRSAWKIMGERLFFITDAVTESKGGAYQHVLRGDRYTLPDGTLSGSSLSMMGCVQRAVNQLGIPLDSALRMASTIPAQMAGQEDLGCIRPGAEANLLVFDENLDWKATISGGEPIV